MTTVHLYNSPDESVSEHGGGCDPARRGRYRSHAAAGSAAIAAPALAVGHAGDPAAPSQAAILRQYCVGCHNARTQAGQLPLAAFAVANPEHSSEVAEKMIRKLRAGLMPPPGARRPDEAVLAALADTLTAQADAHATGVAPGGRTFQLLNRAEYTRSIHDLLALDVNAGDYLPLDPKSANFDNIADSQLLSPTLMQSYLTAAAEISRLAVGDPSATAREATYRVSRWTSQREQVEGAPWDARRPLRRAHLPGRRRVPVPRVLLSRDDGRTGERPRRCTPPRCRSRSRSRSTAIASRCWISIGG